MNFQISRPSPVLSGYIKQYWTIENCMKYGTEHLQRIVPNGLMELMFYLEDLPESTDKEKTISENALLTGQLNGYYDIKVTGRLSLFSIIFQPYGISMFFDIPVGEFFNRNTPLKFILKDKVSELENDLAEAGSFDEKKNIVERFLLERISKSKKKYEFERIRKSVELIDNYKGLISIDRLASFACLSRKQFERTFMDYIGTSPKQFLKIVRFQNAINEKSRNPAFNLTELTYQCGYYDQSHMTNDFSRLSGMTPKQYFKDCEPYSDYFQEIDNKI